MVATPSKKLWGYVDDLGGVHSRLVDSFVLTQRDTDGTPLIGGREPENNILDSWRPGLKARVVYLVCLETGTTRELRVFSLDAPLWTGAAKTVRLWSEGTPRTFQVRRRRMEREFGRKKRLAALGLEQPKPPPAERNLFGSSLEASFFEAWQRTTGIRLAPQHPVLRGKYRIDFAHLPTKTAIELDGYYYHNDPERFRKDRQRDRELSALGWSVVRFAGDEVLEDVQRCVNEALQLIRTRRPGADLGGEPDDGPDRPSGGYPLLR